MLLIKQLFYDRTHIEASNKTLDPSEIFIYKQCAVKGRDEYWYRALVEKTLDKGKVNWFSCASLGL